MKPPIAAFLVALAVHPALACLGSSSAVEHVMENAMWTVDTSANYVTSRSAGASGRPALHRGEGGTAQVRIALPVALVRYRHCEGATWDVELVLPEGVSIRADDAGNAGPSSYEGLAISATALFEIVADPSPAKIRRERAWLQVTVRLGRPPTERIR